MYLSWRKRDVCYQRYRRRSKSRNAPTGKSRSRSCVAISAKESAYSRHRWEIDRKIGERRRYSISIARDVTAVAYTKPTSEIANVVTDKLQPTIIKILRQTAVTRAAHPYARTRVRTRVVAVRSLVTCGNSDSDAISICRSDAIKRTDYPRPSARSSAAFHRFTIAITFPSRYSSRLSPRANVRATQHSLNGYGQTIISGR